MRKRHGQPDSALLPGALLGQGGLSADKGRKTLPSPAPKQVPQPYRSIKTAEQKFV